jgi:hypothetical protein
MPGMSPIPGIWVICGAIVWDGASLGDAEAGAVLGDGDPVRLHGTEEACRRKLSGTLEAREPSLKTNYRESA